MKRQSLVIGRMGVGKTMFCVQFAKFLGLRELQWLVERTDGKTEAKRMATEEAIVSVASAKTQTRQQQSLTLYLPRHRAAQSLVMTDTAGFAEVAYEEAATRQAMAQTLGSLLQAQMVLHVIDAQAVGEAATEQPRRPVQTFLAQLDIQLVAFASSRPTYLILANKLDLPYGKLGYQLLCKAFPKLRILPISALSRTGFREVKRHVCKLA